MGIGRKNEAMEVKKQNTSSCALAKKDKRGVKKKVWFEIRGVVFTAAPGSPCRHSLSSRILHSGGIDRSAARREG